jgi:lipopolysaccharide export system protein LptA
VKLSNLIGIFILLFLTLLPGDSFADNPMMFKTNIAAPLKVNADKMYLDKISLNGGFSGSVYITQGPLNLKSDQMSFTFSNEKDAPLITELFASQGVVLGNEDMTASGNNASYSVINNEILLEGNVIVNNSLTVMKGEKLHIDLRSGKINFLSNEKQNNRIKGELLIDDKNKK